MFKPTVLFSLFSVFFITNAIATQCDELSDYASEQLACEDEFYDYFGVEEFVSIATGTKKSIDKAPSVANVITSEEISLMGANSVHEVIETVTGIHVYPNTVSRLSPSYSIRGIHTSQNPQVLVLLNGIRTTFAFTGARWSQFETGLELIERIEVIRGPGSAVHGADAFAGVINIITKGIDSGSTAEAGIKAGSFATKSSWLNYVNADNDLKYSFNAEWYQSDGDTGRIIEQDALSSSGISLAPGPLDTDRKMIDLHAQVEYEDFYASFWYLENDAGSGPGVAQVLSTSDYDDNQSLSFTLGYAIQLRDNFSELFKW